MGVYEYGLDNPRPDAEISSIEFNATETSTKWFVLGLTLSDAPVYFDPGDVSFGIPDNWGAAAVVYALVEGLAGIVDAGVAFDRAVLSPRWACAGVEKIEATAKYEASGGYLAYRYAFDKKRRTTAVTFTSSAREVDLEILLPRGRSVKRLEVDGVETKARIKKVERSVHACAPVAGIGVHDVTIALR